MLTRRRPLHRSATAVLLAAIPACGLLDGGTERTLVVLDHQQECVGVAIQLCLLVHDAGATTVERMYSTPRGFDYAWGFTYEIRIEEHEVSNPPADGSSIRRELEQVLSMEQVAPGTEFTIFLTAAEGRVQETAPGLFRFYDTRDFACGPDTDCAALSAAVAAGARIQFRFAHPADPGAPLGVLTWGVCDPRLIGSVMCTE